MKREMKEKEREREGGVGGGEGAGESCVRPRGVNVLSTLYRD